MSSGSQPGAHVEGLRSKMTQTRLQPVAEPANGRRACARIATADGSVGPEAVDHAGTTRSLQLVGATAVRAVCGVPGSHVPGCFPRPVRSTWPTMAEPSLLLVQFPQVVSPPAVEYMP